MTVALIGGLLHARVPPVSKGRNGEGLLGRRKNKERERKEK
jgi:hypothetical protein